MKFKGIIYYQDETNIKVLKNKYLYQLKYDPFNGGEMVNKNSFNLLQNSLFKSL